MCTPSGVTSLVKQQAQGQGQSVPPINPIVAKEPVVQPLIDPKKPKNPADIMYNPNKSTVAL